MKQTKEQNRISVIIPVYNTAPYLSRCLDSILQSTHQNLEIICVNDGSTDESLNILEQYRTLDERVVVINQSNSGVSAARNVGMKYATGQFISFIDSDDWVHPQYFELLISAIKDADIAHCEMLRTSRWNTQAEVQDISSIEIVDAFGAAEKNSTDHVWGKLFRKEVVDGLRFEEHIRFGEDKLFASIAIQRAQKIAIIENQLYYYFINPNSAVHTLEHNMYSVACKFLEDAEGNKHALSLKYAYTSFLSCRYLSMYKPDAKKIYRDCNLGMEKCTKIAKETLSKKERFLLKLFYRVPFLYRLYRIAGDRTMIDWEREQRKLKKRGVQ